VSNFAGNGSAGYGEGTANNSKWDSPNAGVIAKDPQTGRYSLFIADTENHRIRLVYLEVEPGKSAFIAGNATAGYVEGTGSAARFRFPRGIAAITDAGGTVTTLLVADTDNHCIRKLTYSSGSWTSAIFSGKGGTSGLINGTATASRYNSPRGIVSSPDGNVYVADTGNAVIRKLTQTGTSTTLATTGGINTPFGITVATTNNLLYVSDSVRHVVWQVNASTGVATWLAGGDVAGFADGTGTAARFNLPAHLAWANTAGGEVVYIADRNNNRIRKLVISSGSATTQAGTGVAGFADGACDTAKFNLPYGVATQAGGALYVIDSENNRIRKIE
jgi:sugar lactone lactonase YvrE